MSLPVAAPCCHCSANFVIYTLLDPISPPLLSQKRLVVIPCIFVAVSLFPLRLATLDASPFLCSGILTVGFWRVLAVDNFPFEVPIMVHSLARFCFDISSWVLISLSLPLRCGSVYREQQLWMSH